MIKVFLTKTLRVFNKYIKINLEHNYQVNSADMTDVVLLHGKADDALRTFERPRHISSGGSLKHS